MLNWKFCQEQEHYTKYLYKSTSQTEENSSFCTCGMIFMLGTPIKCNGKLEKWENKINREK